MKKKFQNFHFDLSDRQPGDEDITQKQLRFLEELGVKITPEVRKLGKWQAAGLIDQVLAARDAGAFAAPKRPRRLGCVFFLVVAVILYLVVTKSTLFKHSPSPQPPTTNGIPVKTPVPTPVPAKAPQQSGIPPTIRITQDYFKPLYKDGRQIGEMGILSGEVLKVISYRMASDEVVVEYNGKPLGIPVAKTDMTTIRN